MLVPLGDLIKKAKNDEEVKDSISKWLTSFSCKQDRDIENFLHNRAMEFEHLNKSRTYLLCDKNIFLGENKLIILGFFTVAMKVLDLPEDLSNHKRKQLDGFSAKLRGEVIKSVPCYLIGQLAKNSAADNQISGEKLIKSAMWAIQLAAKYVGGRYVMVECYDEPHLRKFYTDNGFEEFDHIPDGNIPVVQMLRPIITE